MLGATGGARHSRAASPDNITTRAPSGLNEAPFSCSIGSPIGAPVAASHTRAVLSEDTVATRLPSGLKAALETISPCRIGLPIGAPVAASHTRAVLSVDAVTTRAPSEQNAA